MRFLVCFVAWLPMAATSFAQTTPEAIPTEVQQRLVEMGRRDQQVREKVSKLLLSGNLQSDKFTALRQEMAAVDTSNFAELKEIVERWGWPGIDMVGAEASSAAFLILQHASLADQKALLPLFRTAVSSGKAHAADLALLEDRILVAESKKQLYGSQITAGPDGKPSVAPVDDPENLDARRQAMGLPPMGEYLRHAEEEIGKPIDRSALTRK